jgi:Ca-activated chloride channel family protein
MGIQERLETVKGALRILVRHLGADDRVAIVTFGSDARVVLPPTGAEDASTILAAIDELQPGGSTNLEAGLRMGYDLARRTMTEAGIDRIVLASDGVANVGLTDAQGILGQIREDAANGIELVAVGVGMGNYNDVLLEQLADHGDGFYAYVNTRDEAEALFRDRLTQTLQSVALDAKAQVTFDRESVEEYRLLGYENRAIADHDFTDPGVDAGAIGSGHSVTALYALRLAPDLGPQEHVATVALRWTDPDSGRTQAAERDVRTSAFAPSFREADPHFRFDAIVAATAQALHGDSTGDLSLRDVADIARDEGELLPATPEVGAFLDFLDRVARR